MALSHPNTLATKQFSRVDYTDDYSLFFDAPRATVDTFARCFFHSCPAWVMILLRIRNIIVAPFGIRHNQKLMEVDASSVYAEGKKYQIGDFVGPWRVVDRTDTEIVLRENDTHLDFALSLSVQGQPGERRLLTCTTVVHFNRRIGRLYFFVVRPFHCLIVPSGLKRLVRFVSQLR